MARQWKDGYRGPNIRRPSGQDDEDEFDKLVREKKAEETKKDLEARAKIDVAAKAAELERSDRNYSDIDLIYEKNAK